MRHPNPRLEIMKPCSKNRKLIAWLAMDALPASKASELRAHIQDCPGCSRYLEEISSVAKSLSTPESPPEIQATASFHSRIVRALTAEAARSPWQRLAGWLSPAWLNWRLAVPVAMGIVLVGFALSGLSPHSVPPPAAQPIANDIPAPIRTGDLPPTLSNYQIAANRSPEALDELLAAQARKIPVSAPVYTASTRSAFDAPD
jgi:anti-sigma factor RsiW